MLGALGNRFNTLVWEPELETLRGPKRWAVVCVRMAHVLARDIQDGEITLRAMGLVYTTLLSLVPLLALAFSMLKAFGVNNALRPMLARFLAPLGAQADQIIEKVVAFVQHVQVGVLGVVGVATLLYTVISLIQWVEDGCNFIWQVRRARSLSRRFTEYLSVLIVGPIVVLAAISLTASLTSNAVVHYVSTIEPFGAALYLAGRLTPYVLYSAAFTFLFAFMPNTRVHFLAALGGGIFAGVLWQAASVAFAVFAKNAGNYNAIYSGFAILILLLIWMYVSWLIMLVGCRVAFLLQHNEQLTRLPYPPALGADRREQLGLMIMALVGSRFMAGGKPWQVPQLAHDLRAAPDHIHAVVDQLTAANILIESGENEVNLLPRRDIECLKVNEIMAAVRRGDPAAAPRPRDDSPYRQVMAWIDRGEAARRNALGDLTLRELVSAIIQERTEERPPASALAYAKDQTLRTGTRQ